MDRPITEQAEMLAASGHRLDAVRLLENGARRGDREALFTLAAWRLTGEQLPRDLTLARDLFARAARGPRAAAAVHIAFMANGTGAAADWPRAMELLAAFAAHDPAARAQHHLIAAMSLAGDGAPMTVPTPERLSGKPDVLLFRNLFSMRECHYLCWLAEPMLEPAVVIDPVSGRHIRDPVRTSDVAAFPLAIENPAIRALNQRISAASGTDVACGEPLQILSYRPGQQYHAHVDAIAGTDNQRVITVLVYLNSDYAGGETRFLPNGPSVKGATGDAILFRNVDLHGRADPASRHAGLPVTKGRKLVASRWIRERPLDLGEAKRT